MTDGVTSGRFKLGAWVVSERRTRAFDGSSRVDNPLQERTSITVPLLTLDVRLTRRFGAQAAASIPDITRTALNYRETFRGIGDTSLVGWYRLRPIQRWNITLNVGASLPTGRTETPRFRQELRSGSLVPMSRLQRGTGTFDPLFGMSLDRRFPPFTVFGSLAARTPVYENDKGLRTGASWELDGGTAREISTHRIIGFARLGWLHRQQDIFRGTPVLVGGGNWLYFTPGVAVQAGKRITVQAEVKLPVHRSLANTQLDSRAVLQFGISRAF